MPREWKESLQEKLTETYDATKAHTLFEKYQLAFPTNYREECTIEDAITDIEHIEKLSAKNPIDVHFYLSPDQNIHVRLYQFAHPTPLSDVLPMLEHMDLKTYDEHPYHLHLRELSAWISDFMVTYPHATNIEMDKIKLNFQDAFLNILSGTSENDGFNKLILGAQLSWQEIIVLRAYAKYLRQAAFAFSQHYIEEALANNPVITKNLIQYFFAKFDPESKSKMDLNEIEKNIFQLLEKVTSLDEDRILRRLLELMKATLRTNFFQKQANGKSKEYLSLKLSSQQVPELPLPLPLYEIFVYSPRFEGIHLRNSKVARGGLRWSDRREDFRTEILGLMKAQKVKNAVIVPSGAKGGFVLKAIPSQATRDVIQAEVVACYKSFIRGLLDLTDNLSNGKVIKPENVKCYDEDDTYLVVAADKGTATFSDTANSISKEYNFWLGDAFASGGSAGYDHKKMGITARGAWESVKRHFSELNINIFETDFTCVGIGDMSGDVFGNGLIYTPHIKLLAAFDHRHIFLDPNPDAATSFKERERMFNLPTSSWEDYNPSLISKGGGVFKRSSKSIPISPEVKKALSIEADSLMPTELIRLLLRAPVDLLWNGGIGTYIKASTESHADVGDKTNEALRVNGNELKCKVVGEGGNLGFTQLGRVEFALNGGLINTDFIDNSAGVDCSDHEVNIKILLNQEVFKNNITEAQRNEILAGMTKEVGNLVLQDNYNQALALSIANFNSPQLITIHQHYIKELESQGILNRGVEFLPEDKKLIERKIAGQGLTRPELAVLLAYTKIHIKNEILNSSIPDHPFLAQILYTAFPASLKQNYAKELLKHSLHREIIATQLSNQIVNETSIPFVYNLQNETGATIPEILRACLVTSRIFEAWDLQHLISTLDHKISAKTQYELLEHVKRLIYLSTRWFLRHKALTDENLETIINEFAGPVKELASIVPSLMGGITKTYLETLSAEFSKAGLSLDIARRVAGIRAMYTALNIIQVAHQNKFDLLKTSQIYFSVGEYFNLLWFRDRIANDNREGYWETLARLTLRDELDVLQKLITTAILHHNKNPDSATQAIQDWIANHHRPVERWEKILEMLHDSTSVDYVMFFIALRELSEIIQNSAVKIT